MTITLNPYQIVVTMPEKEAVEAVRSILRNVREQDTIEAIRALVNAREWDDEG